MADEKVQENGVSPDPMPETMTLQETGVGSVAADTMTISESGIGAAAATTMTISECGIGAAAAERMSVKGSSMVMVAAETIEGEDVKILFTVQAAFIFGLTLAVALFLLRKLFKR